MKFSSTILKDVWAKECSKEASKMYDDSTEQVKSLDESSAEEQFYGNSFRESTEEDLIAKAEKDKVQREQKLDRKSVV
mgnify:CR=1 FL=1